MSVKIILRDAREEREEEAYEERARNEDEEMAQVKYENDMREEELRRREEE